MSTVGTMHPPELPDSMPSHSQWLSGQGAGVWFCIDKTNNPNEFRVRRFNPEGEVDCDRVFTKEYHGLEFNISSPYQFAHVSHCTRCKIEQEGELFLFNYHEE